MDYKRILKEMQDAPPLEGDDIDSFDLGTDDIEAPEVTEDEEGIVVGSIVNVIDSDSFTAEDLKMDEDEFTSFKQKVEDGEYAVVFDEDDDNTDVVSIVFEDGLEAFGMPKLNLTLVTDHETGEVEDTEVPPEEDLEV